MIFDLENEDKTQKDAETPDSVKHEGLIEIARNSAIKKYFQVLIREYNTKIIELVKPATIDRRDELLQWYSKKDSLQRLLKTAAEELQKEEGK